MCPAITDAYNVFILSKSKHLAENDLSTDKWICLLFTEYSNSLKNTPSDSNYLITSCYFVFYAWETFYFE